ncbi:MAG: hypothetical protein M3065_01480 [Actinomycetota bacterium]|nr:hypothetical protein [Actinomycetota bacterium]
MKPTVGRTGRARPLTVSAAFGVIAFLLPLVAASTAGAIPSAARQLQIAQEHAPELFFDSSEHWAPLEVNAYVAEGNHYLCSKADGSAATRRR